MNSDIVISDCWKEMLTTGDSLGFFGTKPRFGGKIFCPVNNPPSVISANGLVAEA